MSRIRRGGVRGQRGRSTGDQQPGRQKQPATSADRPRSRSPVDSTWKQKSCQVADVPFTGKPGIQVQVPTSALEFAQLFCLTDEDLKYVAAETNRYADQFFAKKPKDSLPANSRLRDWNDITDEELKLFFCISYKHGISCEAKIGGLLVNG